MFRPNFGEGQNISPGCPKEVSMPEDDAFAMNMVCSVIHHRNNAAFDHLTPKQVLTLAITADKYDCIDPLRNASRLWVKPRNTSDIEELKHLVAAAYLFDDAQAFEEITSALIFNHTDPFHCLVEGEVDSIPPGRTFCEQSPSGVLNIVANTYLKVYWKSEGARYA
jgi:hypothetical protein